VRRIKAAFDADAAAAARATDAELAAAAGTSSYRPVHHHALKEPY